MHEHGWTQEQSQERTIQLEQNYNSAVEATLNVTLLGFLDLLGEKLAAHLDLLTVARENCARWLREPDALLADPQNRPEGFARLNAVLSGENEAARRLRDFHPLAGILTREERRRAKNSICLSPR